jgi:UDP-N-acetylglucosamine 4,6-dehydratase
MNRIMITGGAGSLGRELVDYIHETNKDDLVIVYSRDEAKHAKYYRNRNNVKCVIGDIRDKNKLKQVLVENSVNAVIHAGALKRIDDMELSPDECIKTNVIGSMNVAESITEVNNTKNLVDTDNEIKGILVSTDKACLPINAYGSSKHLAERIFIRHGLRVARYGNVLGSRGSFIPLWSKLLRDGDKIPLTDNRCTRYLFSLRDAAKLVYHTLFDLDSLGSLTVVPKLKSYKVVDVLKVLCKLEGIEYKDDMVETIGLRPGEKLHEDMLSLPEIAESYTISSDKATEYLNNDNFIVVRPSIWNNNVLYKHLSYINKYNGEPLNSDTDVVLDDMSSLEELIKGCLE